MKALRSMYDAMPTLLTDEAAPDAVRAFEHRTWRRLDYVEMALLGVGGLMPALFTLAVFTDVVTRMLGVPVSWLQELILATFVWGLFVGGTVAVRRRLHFRLTTMVDSMRGTRRKVFETVNNGVILVIAAWMVISGGQFASMATGIFLQPTQHPVALISIAIPVSGVLIALFTVEGLVTGWTRGFDSNHDSNSTEDGEIDG